MNATIETSGRDWLNTAEAARRLGISDATLRRHASHGKIRAHRLGRRSPYRFARRDVETLEHVLGGSR